MLRTGSVALSDNMSRFPTRKGDATLRAPPSGVLASPQDGHAVRHVRMCPAVPVACAGDAVLPCVQSCNRAGRHSPASRSPPAILSFCQPVSRQPLPALAVCPPGPPPSPLRRHTRPVYRAAHHEAPPSRPRAGTAPLRGRTTRRMQPPAACAVCLQGVRLRRGVSLAMCPRGPASAFLSSRVKGAASTTAFPACYVAMPKAVRRGRLAR